MKLVAYAKLNLFLHVIGRYPNGYHSIESLFAFCADLYDEIEIERAAKLSVRVVYSAFPEAYDIPEEDNLLYKILEYLGLKFEVKLYKKIPIGAGLGGGSADAAVMINYLLQHNYISIDDIKLLSSFGADIPPCMVQKACIGVGIGDEIIAHLVLPELYAIIVKPLFSIATRDIYVKSVSAFQKSCNIADLDVFNLESFKGFIATKHNGLLEPILFFYPEIKHLVSDIQSLEGCFYSNVSGSGSACFGLFENKNDALKALQAMRQKNKHDFLYVTQVI
jgi:4-diphosphocytidyl-2-C-methyl-D-erythritol kinase